MEDIRYIGIDWGEKRIGLAFAESGSNVAVPHKLVSNIEEVMKEIMSEEVSCVVLGQPVKMSGDTENLMKGFLKFSKDLEGKLKDSDIELEIIDERFTSKAADARVGTKKTKVSRDVIAAMEILQSYLDRKSNGII